MAALTNETHDPALRSWVVSANGHPDFPIQNLPFAVFRRSGTDEAWRGGVAIGDEVLDLAALATANELSSVAGAALKAAAAPRLNEFMAMGAAAWSALRLALSRSLRSGSASEGVWQSALVPQSDAEFRLAVDVGDYTDFYTSIHHATTVGRLFRPDNPLLPNYQWVPIGYHGRSSTLGIGQSFRRPKGQLMLPGAQAPELLPSRRMDYELELGIFIGQGNAQGESIPIDAAESHVFGYSLLNDWSARDIQSWEYQPLGPFLSKNFATTLSPWIITNEALLPYRSPWDRKPEDPQPLEYINSTANRERGAIDIKMEVLIETEKMRTTGCKPVVLSTTSFQHAYWSVAQMVAHHTINGCELRPGDLFGSGTQSGPREEEAGSLLELTKGGKQSIRVGDETRTFLEDGDSVILRGWCQRQGAVRIGFGESRGTLLAA